MTTIKQIVPVGDGHNSQLGIFGLGDDDKIYVWNQSTEEWDLFSSKGKDTSEVPF